MAGYVAEVLALVARIPSGRVLAYIDIAEYLYAASERGSPAVVASIMVSHGADVPNWHRVVSGGGRLRPGRETEARGRLVAEGVPFRGSRVLMADARWLRRGMDGADE
ncbi:MAG: hypothetical protein AUI14_19815 [Actinobacteria bacterium 13_2_20CM_2_71_6]|nr:MAG: hypothetical protein AUI14_19815 [Actinobacteria bacterium 13_2_20CM_2_71_6]